MRLPYRLIPPLVLVLALTTPARAGRLDDLVKALGGHDEPARSLARQLLPREDVTQSVPKILPLLASDDPNVWNAANLTLADIANEVSIPGRSKAERTFVAAQLTTLVAPGCPLELRHRALRLLPIVVPDGFDVGPIARWLDDPNEREKARVALEEMRTDCARAALAAHLNPGDPEFTVALLNALGRLEDATSRPAVQKLAKDKDARIRAAASRALAWSGDLAELETARAVVASADAATRSEAVDAMLRHLATLTRKLANDSAPIRIGGHGRAWDDWAAARRAAIAAYTDLLETGHGVEKDAALAGLGRIGDASSVAVVIATIKDAEPPTLLVGIDALRKMPGDDVSKALVAAYPALSTELKARLIPALGSRQHPAVLPILEEASASPDAQLRRAAYAAIAETGLHDSVGRLVALAGRAHDDDRPAIVDGLNKLGTTLAARGQKTAAGTAFMYALASAPASHSAQRRTALEGVAANPVADAYASVKNASGEASLREPALKALLGVAEALIAAGQKPKAIELLERVRALNPPAELVPALVRDMAAAGSSTDLRGLLGTISRWYVIGPFELGEKNEGWKTAYVGEPDVDMVARFMTGKRRVQWTPVVSTEANGHIDLLKTVGKRDHCVGYAYAEIVLDKPADAVLLLGVDDSEKIWVNGKLVYEQFVARGFTPDEDKVPVSLRAGVNKILLKIYQNGMGWEFCCRIVGADGRPVPFTQKSE